MSFYSVIFNSNCHSFAVKLCENANKRVNLLFKTRNRNFRSMSQKVNQNKAYIAITVPQEAGNNVSVRRFPFIFRRNIASNKKSDNTENSHILRLLALAKKEKWKLLGMTAVLYKYNQNPNTFLLFFKVQYVY